MEEQEFKSLIEEHREEIEREYWLAVRENLWPDPIILLCDMKLRAGRAAIMALRGMEGSPLQRHRTVSPGNDGLKVVAAQDAAAISPLFLFLLPNITSAISRWIGEGMVVVGFADDDGPAFLPIASFPE
ncbi:MAG: hypothetical protein KGL39_17060 [Patescibacteria group bacterium]|nr:hypothetical protein [Patescibacteria group bacterium]